MHRRKNKEEQEERKGNRPTDALTNNMKTIEEQEKKTDDDGENPVLPGVPRKEHTERKPRQTKYRKSNPQKQQNRRQEMEYAKRIVRSPFPKEGEEKQRIEKREKQQHAKKECPIGKGREKTHYKTYANQGPPEEDDESGLRRMFQGHRDYL
ncbi:hypothetical protein HYS30_02650 [Candidatus Peregrinibacteria bacterium]|nr:hypothetical protein [Candidatus Peregrinibacteria bacterium]MBI2117353.1 hypothetical protein [Candidatus Peregrinibacteria bacterium]